MSAPYSRMEAHSPGARPPWDSGRVQATVDECDALRTRVAELEAEVPWLKDMRVQNGVLDITIEGARVALGHVCSALAVNFETDKGINYVQYEVRSRGREFVLTLQKASGKTPHQLRAEAEQRVAELEAKLAAPDPIVAFELRNAATRVASLEAQLVTEIERSAMEARRSARLVAEEREACAKVAQDAGALTDIAAAIRARGAQ